MSTRVFVTNWVPVIAWMIVIFAGSTDVLSAEHTSRFLMPFLRWLDPHMSFATIASINVVLRKLGHVTEYAILAALLWRALRATLRATRLRSPRRPSARQASTLWIGAIALIASALFAISDEFHQSFVGTRTASAQDVLIDLTGALIAVATCWLFASRRALQKS